LKAQVGAYDKRITMGFSATANMKSSMIFPILFLKIDGVYDEKRWVFPVSARWGGVSPLALFLCAERRYRELGFKGGLI